MKKKSFNEIDWGKAGISAVAAGPTIAKAVTSFASKSFTFVAPSLSAASQLVAGKIITVTGAQVLQGVGVGAIGATILLSKGSGPRMGHNQYENKQFKEAMKQLRISRTDPRRKIAHEGVDGTAETLKQLIEAIKEILGL